MKLVENTKILTQEQNLYQAGKYINSPEHFLVKAAHLDFAAVVVRADVRLV